MAVCEWCKREYEPTAKGQRYCGVNCGTRASASPKKKGVYLACDTCGCKVYLSLSAYKLHLGKKNGHVYCYRHRNEYRIGPDGTKLVRKHV